MKISIYKHLFARHLINWLILSLILTYIFYPKGLPTDKVFLLVFLRTISFAMVYYIFLFFIADRISDNNFRKYVMRLLLVYILFIALFYVVDLKLMGFLYNSNLYNLSMRWLINTSLFFAMISFMSYSFYKNNSNIAVLNKLACEEQLHLRRQIFFIRNQFNHHISFNFLNHCYSNMKKDSSGARMIELYSEMLRYTLDSKPSGLVPLKREIQYIQQYISLNELLDKRLFIQFTVLGSISGKMIQPCILISFIENAIKHGVLYDPTSPVKILMDSKEHSLEFAVENRKRMPGNTVSRGIGYLNAKAQLDIYYHNQYKLSIDNTDQLYVCRLILNI
jgi:two-component system, LytTR family, sensor kinase